MTNHPNRSSSNPWDLIVQTREPRASGGYEDVWRVHSTFATKAEASAELKRQTTIKPPVFKPTGAHEISVDNFIELERRDRKGLWPAVTGYFIQLSSTTKWERENMSRGSAPAIGIRFE